MVDFDPWLGKGPFGCGGLGCALFFRNGCCGGAGVLKLYRKACWGRMELEVAVFDLAVLGTTARGLCAGFVETCNGACWGCNFVMALGGSVELLF